MNTGVKLGVAAALGAPPYGNTPPWADDVAVPNVAVLAEASPFCDDRKAGLPVVPLTAGAIPNTEAA